MNGTVLEHNGSFWVVECPEAPTYLQRLFISPWLVAPELRSSLKAGDKVRLSFGGGLWQISEVLP